MKTLRYAFWAIVGLCLIMVGVANRDPVTLHAFPEFLSRALGIAPTIELPLFVAIFIGVGIGLLIGFLWEWLREHKMRADGRAKGRELEQLKAEMSRLRDTDGDGKDDVLQILEASEKA